MSACDCDQHIRELRQLVRTFKDVIDRSRSVLDLLLQLYDEERARGATTTAPPPPPPPTTTISKVEISFV